MTFSKPGSQLAAEMSMTDNNIVDGEVWCVLSGVAKGTIIPKEAPKLDHAHHLVYEVRVRVATQQVLPGMQLCLHRTKAGRGGGGVKDITSQGGVGTLWWVVEARGEEKS